MNTLRVSETRVLRSGNIGCVPAQATQRAGDQVFSWRERHHFLTQHGIHSQHFTALQPGMSYFDMPGVGYVSFASKWGHAMVLGDPVCAEQNRALLLEKFLDCHPSASFVQVSSPVAALLHRRHRYSGTQFGIEQKIKLSDWSIAGKSRKGIRKAVNQAAAQGIVVKESVRPLDVDDVCARWLSTRKVRSREIKFLVRPRKMPHVDGTRYFYAWQKSQPIGFAYFDPGYHQGAISSYLPNISRACPAFTQGLFYVIMVHAMDVFRNEGVEWLDLGLNPMVIDGPRVAHESRLVRTVFRMVYRYGRHYNFRGLHFTKRRFGGECSPTYYCHRPKLPVADLGRMVSLIGLF